MIGIPILLSLLTACSDNSDNSGDNDIHANIPKSPEKVTVGFFSPGHVDRYVPYVQHSIVNIYPMRLPGGQLRIDLGRLEMMLNYVNGFNHRITLELGPSITDTVAPDQLNMSYTKLNGEPAQKAFKAMPKNKLKRLVSNEELARRIEGLPELIKQYRDNVGIILLVDEPYLNGVPKDELDRVILALKGIFAEHDLNDLAYGAVYASALFNKEFAGLINRKMMDYVERIDTYYHNKKHLLEDESKHGEKFRGWVNAINNHRLVTYDRANNMYIAGGLPQHIDYVGFDFYISTTLLDSIHVDTLDYLHDLGMAECAGFDNVAMAEIQQQLSFIDDGPFVEDAAAMKADRKLLDKIFDCRMGASTKLLAAEIEKLKKPVNVFMIAESSANGVVEFDSKGRMEADQPQAVVEQRIFDEVHRSYLFYLENKDFFNAGLVFFLYPDSFDHSINLQVLGAESADSVLDYIYSFSHPATYDREAAKNIPDFEEFKGIYMRR